MAGRQVLAQLGRSDIILSGSPDITFFLEVYKPQGVFASRVIQVQFENPPNWNTDQSVELPLHGDLMTAMYACFDLVLPSGTAFYDSAGTLMINRVELYSGNQLIERLWGEFITLVNDIEYSAGQQPGIINLVGGQALNGTNNPLTNYTVKLPFKCLERGLPVVPGMYFRLVLNDIPDFCATSASGITLNFRYLVEYIFLSDDERQYIKNRGTVTYVGESVERARYLVPGGSSNIRCITEFLHPVKELFFTIQNSTSPGFDYWYDSSNITSNVYFQNYSNINHLNNLGIYFNQAACLEPFLGTTLNLGTAQFIENHSRVPTRPFYMYSFSLDPEGSTPSGALNFGMIKNQYFDFYLVPSQKQRILTIWARYYQFIEVAGFSRLRVIFDSISDNGTSAFLP